MYKDRQAYLPFYLPLQELLFLAAVAAIKPKGESALHSPGSWGCLRNSYDNTRYA